jgi:hypothetical protein
MASKYNQLIFDKTLIKPTLPIRLSGYQPQYFPRLHYFNRILDSDVFEISDYVQFVKKHDFPTPDGGRQRDKSFQSHTLIKLNQGGHFLTVPADDGSLLPINNTPIDYHTNWPHKHLESIRTGYSKSVNFKRFFAELEEILQIKYQSLGDLNILTVLWGITRLITDQEIKPSQLSIQIMNELLESHHHPFRLKRVFLASDSPISAPVKGQASDWIIKLCNYAKATEYFHGGTSGTSYMDEQKFKKAGIKTIIQDWTCNPYKQQYMQVGFNRNLSIIDLIFNEPLENRQSIILGGG